MYSKIKIVFFIFAVFLFCQAVLAAPEDAPATDGSKDVLGDLQKNVNSFFQDTLKVEKVWESITSNLKDFGEKVQTGAQELAKTIQEGISKPEEAKN